MIYDVWPIKGKRRRHTFLFTAETGGVIEITHFPAHQSKNKRNTDRQEVTKGCFLEVST